jgi:hypothetical protein
MCTFRKGNTDVPLSRTAAPGTAPWPWKRLHNSTLIAANKNIMPELSRDAGELSNIQQKPMNTIFVTGCFPMETVRDNTLIELVEWFDC